MEFYLQADRKFDGELFVRDYYRSGGRQGLVEDAIIVQHPSLWATFAKLREEQWETLSAKAFENPGVPVFPEVEGKKETPVETEEDN